MAKYLDLAGLQTLWAKIKGTFIAQDATVTDGHVAVFTVDDSGDATIVGLADGGATNNHSHPVVSSSAAGFAPQLPTTNSTTISSQANEWVLTTTSGGTPSWRKLPSNAFNDHTYTVNNGTFQIAGNGTAANTLFTANGATAVGINFANGTGNTVSVTASSGSTAAKVVINNDHTKTSITEKTTYPTGETASANGGTITVRDVIVNANGHVTGTQDRTITLSQAAITRNVTKANAAVTANHLVAWNANAAVGADGVVKDSGYTVETSLSGGASAIPTSAAVSAAISGLSGAMHFVGTSTDTMTDGQTTNPTVSSVSSFSAGDVVVDSTETEFVLGNEATPKWHKLGDANSYALSSVSVTGTGVLGGGGTLTQNRTITHNTSALGISTDTSYGPGADVTGSNGTTIKVPQITVDKYGHITAVTERTYTSVNSTYTVNNAALNLQGSSGDAIASGFSANGSTATTFKFAVGTGDTISSIGVAKSGAVNTITINGATMPTALKNPNSLKIGTKAGSSGTATDSFTYDGSGTKTLYFSSADASTTNVKFTVTSDGFVTGTVTEADTKGFNVVCASASGYANAQVAASTNAIYLNHIEGTSTVKSAHKIVGSGSVKVSSDASGNITIAGTTYTNNVTTAAFVAASTSATEATASGTAISNGSVYYILREGSTNTATKIYGDAGIGVTKATGSVNNILISHTNAVTAKTAYGSTATTASANGGTLVVTDVKYDAQGHITASTDRTITLSQADTKNTAGTSNKTATKMFLAAATTQAANPQTFSNQYVYIGTDNYLYCGSGDSGTWPKKVMVSGDMVEITTEEINALS